MLKTNLLIARHGNTFGPNDIVRRIGVTDLPLVESGLLQGARLGLYLKENQLIPDMIFTSQLKRTQQTAEEAQKSMGTQLEVQPLSIFNEIDYGIDENEPEERVVARLGKEALTAWEKNATVPPGWKVSPDEIINHWYQFSKTILNHYSGKIILVITSNGIARFSSYLTGSFSEFAKTHSIKISTGGLCIFENVKNSKDWNCLHWNIRP